MYKHIRIANMTPGEVIDGFQIDRCRPLDGVNLVMRPIEMFAKEVHQE